jgi:hypothetical protein
MIRFELAIIMLNSIFDYVNDNKIKVIIVDKCGIRTKVNLSDTNSLLHFRHTCVDHISFLGGCIVMTIDGKKDRWIYKNLSLHSLLQFKHPKSKVVIFDQFGDDIYVGWVEDLIRSGYDYVLAAPVMHQSGINIDVLI